MILRLAGRSEIRGHRNGTVINAGHGLTHRVTRAAGLVKKVRRIAILARGCDSETAMSCGGLPQGVWTTQGRRMDGDMARRGFVLEPVALAVGRLYLYFAGRLGW